MWLWSVPGTKARQQLEASTLENLNPTQKYHLLSSCRGLHWGLPADMPSGKILPYPVSTPLIYEQF